MILRWVHGLSLRTQMLIALATVPVVVALFGTSFVRVAFDLVLDEQERAILAPVAQSIRVAIGLTVVCASVAATGVALLLWGSIRHHVMRMYDATVAIADGHFGHRIGGRPRRDELGHLAHGIDAMAMRLEQLEQARRRLLACVSHELRTPLTIVRGHAFTLGRDEIDPARRQRYDLIEAESARLADLMEDLLVAASLHAGGVRLERRACSLADLVGDSVRRVADAARDADIDVRIRRCVGSHDVEVDGARIDQAITNLLLNAIRHAPPGSEVVTDIGTTDARDHVVTISNRSAPIPAEIADRLFDPFVQHGSVRGSVGLGLGIARDLVEAHGGVLELAARGERGIVTLRLELPATARRSRGESSRAPLQRWSSHPGWV